MARHHSLRLGTSLVGFGIVLLAYAGSASPAGAEPLLLNGDFEDGTAPLKGSGLSVSDCPARSGSSAARLEADQAGNSFLRQSVPVQGDAGPYTFQGFALLEAGEAGARAEIRWYDDDGSKIGEVVEPAIDLEDAYAAFEVEAATSPSLARTAVVQVSLSPSGASASICLDDLSFAGPVQQPATATATPTATPTATATPTSPPAAAPAGQGAASPTAAPAATSSTSGPTSGGTATGITALQSTGIGFTNGDFEAGLSGWSKYGGELSLVASPRHGGSGAGALTSATTSTKWAYQIVPVSQAGYYEFAGFLLPAGDVDEAYLRVSFYTTTDASGQNIGSIDSTARLAGPASGYAFLTTGPVQPLAGARSARVRVMLAPASAAPATVYLDDLSFGPGSAPLEPTVESTATPTPPPPTPPPPPPATDASLRPLAPVAPLAPDATTAAPTATPTAIPSPTATPTATAAPAVNLEPVSPAPAQTEARSNDDAALSTAALLSLGALVVIVSGAGAYTLSRHAAER